MTTGSSLATISADVGRMPVPAGCGTSPGSESKTSSRNMGDISEGDGGGLRMIHGDSWARLFPTRVQRAIIDGLDRATGARVPETGPERPPVTRVPGHDAPTPGASGPRVGPSRTPRPT